VWDIEDLVALGSDLKGTATTPSLTN
jgi:hypothetical protein